MNISADTFNSIFKTQIPFIPTLGQSEAIKILSNFVTSEQNNIFFILKGYAGTGKTTLVSSLVKALNLSNIKSILLAPTGRAAKIFSNYAEKKAFTIHQHIYSVKYKDGFISFLRKENKFYDTIFIIDEVSMIGNTATTANSYNGLLDDLVDYVKGGSNCKTIFIGDNAQLPPVKSDESPALNEEYLNTVFDINVSSFQLKEVVRQALNSGILYNANVIRDKIEKGKFNFPIFENIKFNDFSNIEGIYLEELLHELYDSNEISENIIITRSNKRAYVFNREIRSRILYKEENIESGDFLMVVKNNYYWLNSDSEVGFIANGDMLELISINKAESLYGFDFADVTVKLCDYPNHSNIDIKIILNSLDCEGASLSEEQTNSLYKQVALDYENIENRKIRYLKIKNDPYLNAAQVKFGYALTCHKTQGGQWKNVIIDNLYLPGDNINKETLRWLYTAITRATTNLYLVNFPSFFFSSL